jgi:hypothetical protein
MNQILRCVVAMERYLPTARMPGVSLMLRAHLP